MWRAFFLSCAILFTAGGGAIAEKRVALVIGNQKYPGNAALDNPELDAREIAKALREVGFTLAGNRPFLNLDKAAMERALQEFATLAQNADVALFYFSGHGVQINGINYLSPVEVEKVARGSVDLQLVNADIVVRVLDASNAKLKMMLLDACRNNPFLGTKGPSGGLAFMPAPQGTIIGFATQPGALASDGLKGKNSPYTQALITMLGRAGYELFTFLNEVGLTVMAATNKEQQPWISSSPITGKFYFRPPLATPPIVAHGGEPAPSTDGRHGPVPTVGPVTGGGLPFIQLAYRQLDGKDFSGARKTLDDAIRVDPNLADAYSYRGFSWYLEGLSHKNPSAALEAYRAGFRDLDAAIRLNPGYSVARQHRGNAIVASYKALKALDRPVNQILDKGVDDLRAAVELNPTSSAHRYWLGEAYLLKGRYQAAIDTFNKAIELRSRYAAPHSGLCMAYRMLGNMSEARRYADLAAKRDSRISSRPCLTAAVGTLPPQ